MAARALDVRGEMFAPSNKIMIKKNKCRLKQLFCGIVVF